MDPLDIAQDPASGYLFVSEYGSKRITLLRPVAAGSNIAPSTGTMVFNDVVGGTASPARTLTLTNTGTAPAAGGLGGDPALHGTSSLPTQMTSL